MRRHALALGHARGDVGSKDSTAALSFNGESVNSATVPDCAEHANFTVRVGLGSTTGVNAKAYYDNVVFAVDP